MRKFHSYGPVDCQEHFCVSRKKLLHRCIDQLIGNPDKCGHYFTIWAPRQTGKTWLMRQAETHIKNKYKDRFDLHSLSLGRLRGMGFKQSDELNLPQDLSDVLEGELPGSPCVKTWKDFFQLFLKENSIWKRPLILFIDEVDTTPPLLLDIMVNQFREMYLDRENNFLHGLALIGVRAVLGIESERGSPFNIQKSLHVPNLTPEEVKELFSQYQEESGQIVEAEAVIKIYEATRGQPGLVSWFGELLTESDNNKAAAVTIAEFDRVLYMAAQALPNTNVMNIIAKADREPYRSVVLDLFKTDGKTEFAFDDKYLNYLYMNGVIDTEEQENRLYVRFSSPFIQKRLFNFFSRELFAYVGQMFDPFENLDNILTKSSINIINLIKRYEIYLRNNREWLLKDAPRRKDLRIFEAVFHFNLYMYLHEFLKLHNSRIFPEFPTGNGKIDLLIKHCGKIYGIEVKTWTNASVYQDALAQTAGYGKQLGLSEIFLVFFVESVDDENRGKYEIPCIDEITGVKVIPIFVATGI